MSKPLVIFDMDGVLVDVSDSYREAIARTVGHFSGRKVTRGEIQDCKNEGGWNDDWQLSHHLIRQAGVDVEFGAVVEYFQDIFHGRNGQPALILHERWIARDGLFERLALKHQLAVFTGRLRWEAELTLNRFSPALAFAPVVGADDVARLKPHPDGLLKIIGQVPARQAWYVGDTVDDARAARAADVPFIGIAAPHNTRRAGLIELFRSQNAIAILDDINSLEPVLCQ